MTTFREKLAAERPDLVSPDYNGGCALCPSSYDYEDGPPDFCDTWHPSAETCTECWDRVIPGTEVQPQGKVIYIAGPITGVPRYWEAFEDAEDELHCAGFVTLSPCRLSNGLTWGQYMHIDKAMIDVADAVLFLPGWHNSKGARIEMEYCKEMNKPNYISIDVLKMKERTR